MTAQMSSDDLRTMLSLTAEELRQQEVDEEARNEALFQENHHLISTHGYKRTHEQVTEILKQRIRDDRISRDHNGKPSPKRKKTKLFDDRNAVFSNAVLSVSSGIEDAGESDSTLSTPSLTPKENKNEDDALPLFDNSETDTESDPEFAPYKNASPSGSSTLSWPSSITSSQRSDTDNSEHDEELVSVLRAFEEEAGRNMDQQRRFVSRMLQEAKEARELERALHEEESKRSEAFNSSFLNILGEIVKVLSHQKGQFDGPVN